ncbi:MAG: hypothetical protein CM15mP23_11550 [Cryomorphaceae bacterium]|nr:MAG: hypothetical protein CM15mP23_11550 [Cryomorphaceae bacterium]
MKLLVGVFKNAEEITSTFTGETFTKDSFKVPVTTI